MPYVLEIYAIGDPDTRVAVLDRSECEVKIRRVINGEWSITVNYPIPYLDSALNKASYFTADNARIKLVDTDDSTDYQIFYVSRTEEMDNSDGTLSLIVNGEHESIQRLSEDIVNATYDFQSETPTNILTKILASSTFYSIGTVDYTLPVTVYISYESVMSAIQKLLDACGGEYDVDVTNAEIDILDALGSTTKAIHIRKSRNLRSLRRTRLQGDEINKLYGIGGGEPPVTMAGARHIVSSISGQDVYVTHAKLVIADDIWNNYKVQFDTGAEKGNLFSINDCQAETSEDILTLTGDISSVVAGDKFHIEDASENEVDYLATAAASVWRKEAVYKNPTYRDVINLVEYADLTSVDYPGGMCEGWTDEGGSGYTLGRNTNTAYITHGINSQMITVTNGVDKGVSQTITTVIGKQYKVVVWVYIVSKDVKIKVGSYVSDIKNGTDHPGWQKFTFVGIASGTSTKIQVLGDYNGGNAVFYFDSILFTEDRDGSLSFTLNHDLIDLWYETYDKLIERHGVQIKYTCNFIDLQKMMPNEYIYEEIELGDDIIITDDELNISEIAARITEINYMPFRPEHTEFTVESDESQGL